MKFEPTTLSSDRYRRITISNRLKFQNLIQIRESQTELSVLQLYIHLIYYLYR